MADCNRLGHLKATMKMDALKCKTVPGVMKEMAMFVLVDNLIRTVMLKSAKMQNVNLERISFSDAFRWLDHRGKASLWIRLSSIPRDPIELNRVSESGG